MYGMNGWNKPDGDLISRAAAIDQLRQSYNLLDAEQRLDDLPSAQPDVPDKNVGVIISRQDAIDLLDEQIAICNRSLTNPSISMNDEFAVNVERNSLMAYRDKLECMPSAQPERKKGKWLDDEGHVQKDDYCATCSACKEWSEYLTTYCPNCGADMRGTWEVSE